MRMPLHTKFYGKTSDGFEFGWFWEHLEVMKIEGETAGTIGK